MTIRGSNAPDDGAPASDQAPAHRLGPGWAAPRLVSAIGTTLCSGDLNNPGYTWLLQANSFVHFALNANPNRAGNPSTTEATVPARVLG